MNVQKEFIFNIQDVKEFGAKATIEFELVTKLEKDGSLVVISKDSKKEITLI